jgi:ubiquinone/menaquinone biosynthesis C-methylase UbiE
LKKSKSGLIFYSKWFTIGYMKEHQKTDDESLVKQQIEYYRARASEYDEWVFRKGRYDRGDEHRKQWFDELDIVHKALESSHPGGNILELACGTGIWTERLAPAACRLVAVDVSSEMLDINRRRVNDKRVKYLKADLFSWKPSESFDYIFFGFWLSHIPSSRFDDFWYMINEVLKPKGKVFFVDSMFAQDSTARNHALIERNDRARRKLNDGREFEIVKVFYEPTALERKLNKLGWIGNIKATKQYFLYGRVDR